MISDYSLLGTKHCILYKVMLIIKYAIDLSSLELYNMTYIHCPTFSPIGVSQELDLVIGIDTSDAMSDVKIAKLKKLLLSTINAYELSQQKVRINLMVYGRQPQSIVTLQNGHDIDLLLQGIQALSRQGRYVIKIVICFLIFPKIGVYFRIISL